MADTDTIAFAHVKLPALAWGEKNGTVTNSERRISRQRPLFAAPGEARADWRIVAEVAAAMGFADAFDWRGPDAVFREYAALTTFENDGRRVLDLGPLAELDARAYDALRPIQWPVRAAGGTARLFTDGRYPTPDGRARLSAPRAKGPARKPSKAFPLSLNTGRVRDHWHTMTRTGLAPELCRHEPEPFIEIHPDDAAAAGIKDGALARVRTPFGEAVVLARVDVRQRPGGIFMPMHWTRAFAASGLCNPLVNPAVDPVSGQPEFKHTPASVARYGETWRGFLIARESTPPPLGETLIWRRIPIGGGVLHEFAGRGGEAEQQAVIAALKVPPLHDVISYADEGRGAVRWAALEAGRLSRVLMMATDGALPDRAWLIALFAEAQIAAADRAALLLGRALEAREAGRVVCACMGVSDMAILKAVADGAGDVDSVGAATRAGTNCGSCRIEIARLIRASARPAAAAADKEPALDAV
jgi:assimilatory nitrate reductase catalytic subunit